MFPIMEEIVPISIHSLVKRETHLAAQVAKLLFNFNPLPRKEGDVYNLCQLRARQTDFNPLPRKEGDFSAFPAAFRIDFISIHSLVKRETSIDWLTSGAIILISIHSLVKRETANIAKIQLKS